MKYLALLFILAPVAYANEESIYLRFVEDFTYSKDHDLAYWGMIEYWQTYEQTLALRRGDCEDLAIALQRQLHNAGIWSDLLIIETTGGNHVVVETAKRIYDPSNKLYALKELEPLLMVQSRIRYEAVAYEIWRRRY